MHHIIDMHVTNGHAKGRLDPMTSDVVLITGRIQRFRPAHRRKPGPDGHSAHASIRDPAEL
ncbi:hypothetical protein A5695_14920 [Mycobacterium sp. E1747]|nr:hypothetical protein A5695_14920 [Mycobacterium sp. E1747]